MGASTQIQWCDMTFNPWEGCTRVSPGCAHCYAETRNARFGGGTAPNWGPGAPRRRTSAANWRQPLKWNFTAICDECGETASLPAIAGNLGKCPKCHADAMRRPRVFCASLADWLDDEVPVQWLADLLDLIRRTPNLDWQLLTKRPQNWRARLEMIEGMASDANPVRAFVLAWLAGSAPANAWIGTTVEDQARADERIPALPGIPARIRFLSCEPLLGPVDLLQSVGCSCGRPGCKNDHKWGNRYHIKTGIHWVICGGESGPHARPMHPDWARSLRDQCAAAGVPFLFKQWGEWTPGENLVRGGRLQCATFDGDYWDYCTQTDKQSEDCHADDSPDVYRVGKHAAGRLLEGKEHNEFPEAAT